MRLNRVDFGGALPIEAYGGGGFRIAGKRHEGPLLLIPGDAPAPWAVGAIMQISLADLARPLAEAHRFDTFLIGAGGAIAALPKPVREVLRAQRFPFDVLDTGAACRTYNVLVADGRRVGAALIPVP